jgi:hypothetical protein
MQQQFYKIHGAGLSEAKVLKLTALTLYGCPSAQFLHADRPTTKSVKELVTATGCPVFRRTTNAYASHHFLTCYGTHPPFCELDTTAYFLMEKKWQREAHHSPQFEVRKARSLTSTSLAELYGLLFRRREKLIRIIDYFNSHFICSAEKGQIKIVESEYSLSFLGSNYVF